MTKGKKSDLRVRFAPSPTGHLHVGGARTALFNYLYAKSNDGKFLLRVEDTDKKRSSDEMKEEICKSLEWLGLNWDEEIVYQSARTEKYIENADILLESAAAYKCFCTPEELDLKRTAAQKEKRQYKYDRKCANLGETEVANLISDERPFAVRFLIPEGSTVIEDLVYGRVEVNNREIDDFIILRRDGSPTYQLAVITDDSDMLITYVVRGDDHLPNTPKQILLLEALGKDIPQYAHLPLILGTDGKRLSKRHGATSVEEFKNQGILPEALTNYLSLLGWSPKNDLEFMDMSELLKRFTLEDVSRKSATFDHTKLLWVNGLHIADKDTDDLLKLAIDEWNAASATDIEAEYAGKVINLIRDRAKTVNELIDYGKYFFVEPTEYDEKGRKKHWKTDEVNNRLEQLLDSLRDHDDFSEEGLETLVRQVAEDMELSAAKLIHPLRLALTGYSVSPGIFEVMSILGKDSAISRIDKALTALP